MMSLNKTHPWLVVITFTKFGSDMTGNVAWNTKGMQKSTSFNGNQWPITSLMMSLNRVHHQQVHPSINHGKFGQHPSRNTACMVYQTKKVLFHLKNQWCVATMKRSFNRAHHQPCSITYGNFGQDPFRNTAYMTCQTKNSPFLCRNQWCIATMMTSSWHHSIEHHQSCFNNCKFCEDPSRNTACMTW